MSEIDRKTRLAELRKKRQNRQKEEEKLSTEEPIKDETIKEEEAEVVDEPTISENDKSKDIQGETVNPVEDESIPSKVSYTKDLKEDLSKYYRKANLKTTLKLNKIIQDKYILPN
ncbi:unnamed protein product [Candida verbasci]|uniref:Uncharacterized protein n=1 Tax=Candida verbasci TaxID=1227364 RepID=A0A9W4TVL2_9ASCO|nr:unnamed protein product [Candida verbasci]